MSVGDVLAHYRSWEGLTALLDVMEHATLESISIENSARHTHTHVHAQGDIHKNPHTLDISLSVVLSYPHNFLLKGRAATKARPIFYV